MENTITLNCDVLPTDSSVSLGMRISVDNQIVYENFHVKDKEKVKFTITDDDAEHNLVFELFNKLPEHTKINSNGEIINDALLSIENLTIDDIDISAVFQQLAVYSHDYNGSKPLIEDKFHGSLGCNGTVTLKFTTPFYLWLLENM